MSTTDLNNKVVVLTGATSGLGKATALRIATRGALIVVAGRRQQQGEAVAAAAIAAGAKDALFVQTDITSENDVAALFQKTKDKFGGVDAVFVNAGVFKQDKLFDFTKPFDGLDTLVDVNVKGTTNVARYGVAALQERGSNGAIILTSSIVSAVPAGGLDAAGPDMGPYAATKAYVDTLARIIAAVPNVRTYTVSPSVYLTEMTEGLGLEMLRGMSGMFHSVLKGVPGKPEELAATVEAIIDGTTKWAPGSLIAAEGPFTYDGNLRYQQIYDQKSRGQASVTLSLDDIKDFAGRPAGLTARKVEDLVAAASAEATSTKSPGA